MPQCSADYKQPRTDCMQMHTEKIGLFTVARGESGSGGDRTVRPRRFPHALPPPLPPGYAKTMALEFTDLCCSRAGLPVLTGLSHRVEDGGITLLRGPNGAGKSTLLRVLAGLLPPESGTATLDGIHLGSSRDAWTEAVAFAGHLDAVKPQLTVAENLRFWAALLGAAGIDAALDAFDLGALADRAAHACSAGQKRRLGLARLALVPRRLWLLDEPAVSLDAAATTALTRLVGAHRAAGGMALIATHTDLDLAGAATLTLSPAPPGITTGPARPDPFLADIAR